MDEEQKQKWSELGRLEDEFHKRMGLRIVSLDEVNEVLKLVRQIEEILKELRVS